MSNNLQKTPERIPAQPIRFLGEQNGRPEQVLKGMLAGLLRREKSITKAYLVRVRVGNEKDASVLLGLRASLESVEPVLSKVSLAFASVFNAKEHLDILFLTDAQEREVAEVCKPFFDREEV